MAFGQSTSEEEVARDFSLVHYAKTLLSIFLLLVYNNPAFNSNAFVQICDLLSPKYNPLNSFIIVTKHNSSHFELFTCFVFLISVFFQYK